MPSALVSGEKQVALIPAEEPTQVDTALVSMFERLATNPSVDVEKLERLIQMQERILAHNAEAAFNTAFAQMLPDIPTVVERGRTNNGRYATLEDIIETVRPILARHGFALSHKTEWPDKVTVRVIGILTHRDGHQRTSEFLTEADESGNKNDIQGFGSAVSYGRRYTTKDLLNIVTRSEDDDGRAAGQRAPKDVAAPKGFEDWLTDIGSVADNGWKAFSKAWNESKVEFRNHLMATNRARFDTLKTHAKASGE